MSNSLYLLLLWTALALAVFAVAAVSQRLAATPARLAFGRVPAGRAYTPVLTGLGLAGLAAGILLTLQRAFSTGGKSFPPLEALQLSWQAAYVALFLLVVPLTVAGLVRAGRRLFTWPHRLFPSMVSAEGALAFGVAATLTLGAVAEGLLAYLIATGG